MSDYFHEQMMQKILDAKPSTWLTDGLTEEEVNECIDNAKIKCAVIKALKDAGFVRAEGEWIVKMDCEGKTRTCTCNLCGNETSQYTWVNPNFCSNCGASMKNRGEKY